MSPWRLGPALFLLAWSAFSASLVAQELIPEAGPARFRLRPSIRLGGHFNRVEGLPVMVGPVLQRGGPSPFRADAMVVWRSERRIGTDPKAVGYRIEARQQWGIANALFVGGTAHSLITPVERWHVSDLETSLSTFFGHRDFRDHVERTGFSALVGVQGLDGTLTVRMTYSDEDHDFLPSGSPLTLRRNERPWRPEPLVGTGRVRTVTAAVEFDDQDRPGDPDRGWYFSGAVTAAVGGSLVLPAYMEALPGPATLVADARPVATDFRTGSLEVSRFERFGRSMNLKLRAIVAGSLNGEPIPPQFQYALGGPGSLPGYSVLSVDCGARSKLFSVLQGEGPEAVRVPAYAGYGCDGFALFQVEFGGRIPFGIVAESEPNELEDDFDPPPRLDLRPRWSVFFDGARGWSQSDPVDEAFLGPDTETLMDLGLGLALGPLGLYWAWPLEGEGREGKIFLRIAHRF